jgi:ubiquinone/menaquinone biosynthesis C-methylase UbiE
VKYIEVPEQQIILCPIKETIKVILDIGGGGEGVISKAYPDHVVISIDKSESELLEAGTQFLGIVMDAANTGFIKSSFQLVTSFFTMMYLTKEEKIAVLSEIYRILQKDGELVIWDSDITIKNEEISGDVIITHIIVILPGGKILTPSYGVPYSMVFENSAELLGRLSQEAGFQILESTAIGKSAFQLRLRK